MRDLPPLGTRSPYINLIPQSPPEIFYTFKAEEDIRAGLEVEVSSNTTIRLRRSSKRKPIFGGVAFEDIKAGEYCALSTNGRLIRFADQSEADPADDFSEKGEKDSEDLG